jgi:hypothetical protein
MIEVLVSRQPGDKRGPAISDPLITSIPVALAKGAAEINKSISNRKQLGVTTVLMPFVMPGCLVGVTTYKGRRVGRLRSFEKTYQISGSEFSADCQMTIEVVDDK